MSTAQKDPKKVRAGQASAVARWGTEPRVLRLSNLDPDTRKLILALLRQDREPQAPGVVTAPEGLLALSVDDLVAYALETLRHPTATMDYSSTLRIEDRTYVVIGTERGARNFYLVTSTTLVPVSRPGDLP